ncbi:TonB-dependent receptor [uncultured Mucilaginibacter sp.]|uniref:SusC/RagA family TonB-linked outer membrane protein n=1 Tax=uncultured Mucilaginibacter sp. TaxID=797541 RepID=UPI0025D548B2|nr:TonB-dependent receptor [uncultured Mucilaginibacter sp.]
MKKLLLKTVVVLLLLASHAYAQNRTITGTVTGKDDGAPIPGVSVVLKGTKTGTQTSAAGKFTISVGPGPQSLVVSFIGYISQTVPVTGTNLNIVLEPNQKALDEVVVVGYGTQKKQDVVGSISTINGADLVDQPVQNVEQSLAGKAPGVQITIPNGVLNTPPIFHIRGTNSISLGTQPLIVVDGVVSLTGDYSGGESGGNALSNINPDDIESIDVAKDASATAIYGSRAANGVVFITTKKGKKGDAVVGLDSWVGVTTVNRLPTELNTDQYIALKNQAIANASLSATTAMVPNYDANGNQINTNWKDIVYQRGIAYSTTASVSGGTDKTTYYMSANFGKQGGILKSTEFDNKSMLMNVDHKANKIISLGMKLSYSDQMDLAPTSSGSLSGEAYATAGLGRIAVLLPPNLAPFNNDGSYNLNPSTGALGTMNDKGVSISYTNPQVALDLDRANSEITHLASNIYLQLKPLEWMTFKTTYGIDYITSVNDNFFDPIDNFSGSAASNTASASLTTSINKRWLWDNTAQFDKSFGKNNVSLLLGNEQQGTSVDGFGLGRSILSDPSFNVIQAGFVNVSTAGLNLGKDYLVSFFGRLSYNFDEKYFFTATLRRDGSSVFGSDKKYGIFPSLAGGWEIAKESFWTKIGADKIFSSFKIKGGWGRAGNNSGLNSYSSYGSYGSGLFNGNSTLAPNATGNNQLSWETTSKSDIGIDFGILHDRITGSLGAYYNNTTGLILTYPEPPSAGLPGSPSVNIGSLYNKGIEINLDASVLKTKDFSWTANFNISFNKNMITALVPGVANITYTTSSLETANINQPSGSVGDLYIIKSAGVDPSNGLRIFLNAAGHPVEYNFIGVNEPGLGTAHYFNMDGTPYLTAAGGLNSINQTADASDYGNSTPKEVGGFSSNFKYKNFDLNVLFTYQLGFYVYYGTQATLTDQRFWNNSTIILDNWTTPGQVATYPRVVFGDNVSNGTSYPTDFNTYRGDFLKLKTINFGYTIPKPILSKIGIRSVRLYVTAQNLAIFTKYPGPDPEVSSNGTSNNAPGVDRNTAGNGRTLTAGFSVKF